MTFTRRRWDAWCLGGAAFLALGGAVDALYLSGNPWRIPGFALPMIALFAFRFRIPAEGVDEIPIRSLSRERRQLIAWCVVSLPLVLIAAVLAPRNLEAWWLYPLAAAPHLAITFWLASRSDRARLR